MQCTNHFIKIVLQITLERCSLIEELCSCEKFLMNITEEIVSLELVILFCN